MLTTSNEYSTIFLEKKRLLFDSCILNDWATDERTASILKVVNNIYTFVFCNISMLEVGFGPSGKADPEQVSIAKAIYHSEDLIQVDNEKLYMREVQKIPDLPNVRFSYNPNHQEWLAARTNLIRLMERRGIGGKKVRELSNDALIYFCAWNSRSTIITNNLKDFQIFNEIMADRDPKHLIPVYSIDDLEKSLHTDVSFPENLDG